jgi:uncharacterized damage-inducible protein DinB
VRAIPPERLDWRARPDEFSCAELICHIGAAEQMYVELVAEGRWRYRGHSVPAGATLEGLAAGLEAGHTAAMGRLGGLSDDALDELRPALEGPPVKVWRWLMDLVEHEVHHRSQLAVSLALMGATPPQIYGLGVEDVIARATG